MSIGLTNGNADRSENLFHLNETGRESLAECWHSLTGYYGVTRAVSERTVADLLRRYDARGRHYHNSSHIWALLRWYERHQHQLREPAAVQFAIWFHDVIYRPRHRDNESRSAEFAINTLALLKVPLVLSEAVASLVCATQLHRLTVLPETLHHDASWFLDFDLAILGSSPDVYQAYTQAIRREYAWVPAVLFRRKRRTVLENFLQRPQLYFTESMRGLLETQARENLTNEVAELI